MDKIIAVEPVGLPPIEEHEAYSDEDGVLEDGEARRCYLEAFLDEENAHEIDLETDGTRVEGTFRYNDEDVNIGATGRYNYPGNLRGDVGGTDFSFTGDILTCADYLLDYVDRIEEVRETRRQLAGTGL